MDTMTPNNIPISLQLKCTDLRNSCCSLVISVLGHPGRSFVLGHILCPVIVQFCCPPPGTTFKYNKKSDSIIESLNSLFSTYTNLQFWSISTTKIQLINIFYNQLTPFWFRNYGGYLVWYIMYIADSAVLHWHLNEIALQPLCKQTSTRKYSVEFYMVLSKSSLFFQSKLIREHLTTNQKNIWPVEIFYNIVL